MKKVLFAFLCSLICMPMARASDDIENEVAQKTAIVEQLKKAIAEIDSETMHCKQSENIWKTATIVGGVGVVATGTAAAIQATKLKKAKDAQVTE